MNFKKYKLGELIVNFDRIRKPLSGRERDKKKGIYPYYGATGILDYVDEYLFDGTYILLGEDGTVINEDGSPVLQLVSGKFWVNNHAHILQNVKTKIDFDFLYYLLRNTKVNSIVTGAVQLKISQTNLNNLEVTIPEKIDDQKRIASALKKIDDLITANKAAINKSFNLVLRIFADRFLNSEEKWEEGPISDLILEMKGGDWGKEEPQGNYQEEVYCIRGADIPEIKIGKRGKMPKRYILNKNYLQKSLNDGDLVVEISGGSPTQATGRIARVNSQLLDFYNNKIICTNFCKAVTPKKSFSLFVYCYWLIQYERNIMFSYENGTTGIKNFDINSFITKEFVKIPPVGEVEKFNRAADSIFDKIFVLSNQNEKLEKMIYLLLPKLMSGELDSSKVSFED